MKRLLKFILGVAMTVALASCSLTGRKGEVDSPPKAFLEYGLRYHAEAYLVCVWQVEKTPDGGNWADIQATVVECIKGSKKRGEKLTFKRISDSDVWDFASLRGGLYYVFLQKGIDGGTSVDVQDPQALWNYSDELRRIVEHYKKNHFNFP
jgi:hypothetical protein